MNELDLFFQFEKQGADYIRSLFSLDPIPQETWDRALVFAAQTEEIEFLKVLLEKANPNYKKGKALVQAAATYQWGVVELLSLHCSESYALNQAFLFSIGQSELIFNLLLPKVDPKHNQSEALQLALSAQEETYANFLWPHSDLDEALKALMIYASVDTQAWINAYVQHKQLQTTPSLKQDNTVHRL